MSYGLHSEFDIEQHKLTFKNYLEVLIDAEGRVMYAVPSHVEKAQRLACDKLGITKQELSDRCPREFYFAWLEWVLTQAEAIAVWDDAFMGAANKKQQNTLRRLKLAGIYHGPITKPNR